MVLLEKNEKLFSVGYTKTRQNQYRMGNSRYKKLPKNYYILAV